MQLIPCLIFDFIPGFASGSFYIDYKKVKGWHWESRIIGDLLSWLIVPPLTARVTIQVKKTFTTIMGITAFILPVFIVPYGNSLRQTSAKKGIRIVAFKPNAFV
jgi:hypothetical protein